MALGCLSLFFADQILCSLEAAEDEKLISLGLKDELGKLKKVVYAVRAAFLYAEGRQQNKGLKAQVHRFDIYRLENCLCLVDKKVNELFCWVRETRRERERSVVLMPMLRRKLSNTTFTNFFLTKAMKPFQRQIQKHREFLECDGREYFDGFDKLIDRIKSGEEISIDSFGGDSEGESSYGKNKDQIIQSFISLYVDPDWQEVLKSVGRCLVFQNDDDDLNYVAIKTLRNIFYFKYSSDFKSTKYFLKEQ